MNTSPINQSVKILSQKEIITNKIQAPYPLKRTVYVKYCCELKNFFWLKTQKKRTNERESPRPTEASSECNTCCVGTAIYELRPNIPNPLCPFASRFVVFAFRGVSDSQLEAVVLAVLPILIDNILRDMLFIHLKTQTLLIFFLYFFFFY